MRRAISLVFSMAALALMGLSLASPAQAVDLQLQPSTANQSPGTITVSITGTLLVGVSLNNAPAGTTFQFGTTTGLTPAYGYSFTSTLTEISFIGTQADVNTALATMLISTGAAQGAFTINVTAAPNAAGLYYSAPGDHFYQYTASTGIAWIAAKGAALTQIRNGATGYLVNITSAAENTFVKQNVNAPNIWIGGSDFATEGTWKWADGPEAGTTFWVGTASGSTVAPYNYASWATGEPDNAGDEDYAGTNWRGTIGAWHDVNIIGSGQTPSGYLVEFSPPPGGYTGVSATTLSAAVGTGSGDSAAPPPAWLQAYGRQQADMCRVGWDPSWAEWANNQTGGWVCERTILWDGTSWVQNPNAVWGSYDARLNTPWSGD